MMPRRARLAVAGVPWHIIQRGNNRSACFYSEQDYRLYLYLLKQQAEKFGCTLHAYVLMTNHVHLLATPERIDSAALMMKNLGQRYVQYINRTYRRSGTLWEGRFRSCLTQSEAYVLHCYRYIESNPVRAAMVREPREYQWSSYRTNAHGEHDPLITPHAEYLRLGLNVADRTNNYQSLFASNVDPELIEKIRGATNGNFVLGSERFAREVEATLSRRAVRSRAGRPPARGG